MNQDSAVQFATQYRIHVGLPVRDLARSVQFYATLFGQQPTKTRSGYAKFEVAEPPVNLSLNETAGAVGQVSPISHFGIQVKSSDSVQQAVERLQDAGLETRIEESVTCCYAVQNKVWVKDPDGNPWEVYVVLGDSAVKQGARSDGCCTTQSDACCTDQSGACCAEQAVPNQCA